MKQLPLQKDPSSRTCEELRRAKKRLEKVVRLGRKLRQAVRLAVGDDATGWEAGDGKPVGHKINAATAAWDKEIAP